MRRERYSARRVNVNVVLNTTTIINLDTRGFFSQQNARDKKRDYVRFFTVNLAFFFTTM